MLGYDRLELVNLSSQQLKKKKQQKENLQLLERKDAEQTNYKDYYDFDHVDITYAIGDAVLFLYDTPVKKKKSW